MNQLKARPRRRKAAAIAFVSMVAAVAPLGAFGSIPVNAQLGGPVRMSYKLGPGVKLTTIRYPSTPQEVRILTVTQGAGGVSDLFTPTKSYPGYRKPSAMGAIGNAIAMVNGDFAARDGRPKHMSMIDGELWTSGIQPGAAIGFARGGTGLFVGHPNLVMSGHVGARTIRIHKWNTGRPVGGKLTAFSQRGGRIVTPPGSDNPSLSDPRYCGALLIPQSGFGWMGTARKGIERTYRVEGQPEPCPKTPQPMGSDPGAVVLAGLDDQVGGVAVRNLEVGNSIRLTWILKGWPGVVDVIGAQPMIVQDGANVAPPFNSGDSYFFNYNPRTAVGASQGCADSDNGTLCKTYLMVVDGRRSGWSKGMRLPDLADEFIRLGATWAGNIDGGGGAVMWVAKRNAAYCQAAVSSGGCLVTRPSDGGERVSVVSVGVRSAPDLGEPRALRR